MSSIDWLGLWAALQVIGIVIGLIVFVVMLIVGVIYVFGPVVVDMWRTRGHK